MQRYFTLDQAERTLAELAPELRRALSLRVRMKEVEAELNAITRKVMMSGGMMVDREKVGRIRKSREQIIEQLQTLIESIQQSGCVVKDIDVGLLDFPTLYHGQEVYLCWRADEKGISFWHGLEEGFGGRKPIDDEFRSNHRGDTP